MTNKMLKSRKERISCNLKAILLYVLINDEDERRLKNVKEKDTINQFDEDCTGKGSGNNGVFLDYKTSDNGNGRGCIGLSV